MLSLPEFSSFMAALPGPDSSAHASQLKRLLVEHYDELHGLAVRQIARETPGQSLEATALVNEAVLRMLAPVRPLMIKNPEHFLATAKLIMKRICIDRARHRKTERAGGGQAPVELPSSLADENPAGPGLLIVQEELQRLEREDPEAARIVKLRSHGYSIEEAAQQLDLPRSTAYDLWNFARAWLIRALHGSSAKE